MTGFRKILAVVLTAGMMMTSVLPAYAETVSEIAEIGAAAEVTEVTEITEVKEAAGSRKTEAAVESKETTLTKAAGTAVAYLEYDPEKETYTEKETTDYIVVDDSTTEFDAGKFYVVNGTVTIDSRIENNGTDDEPASLILMDGASLTVQGITNTIITIEDEDEEDEEVENCLVIYGQEKNTGALIAKVPASGSEPLLFRSVSSDAAIGGRSNEPGGMLFVHGGTITAVGGGGKKVSGGAGIGGGASGNGGTTYIFGGTVTATGGNGGSGIGSGDLGEEGGKLVVCGGTVTATGGEYAAGIGGGASGNGGETLITGGTVTAIGGYQAAGIGSGTDVDAVYLKKRLVPLNGGLLQVDGGTVTATGGDNGGAGIGGGNGGAGRDVIINGGTVTATGGCDGGAGIGGGQGGNGASVTINGGRITAIGSDGGAGIGGGEDSDDHGDLTAKDGLSLKILAGEEKESAAEKDLSAYLQDRVAYFSAEAGYTVTFSGNFEGTGFNEELIEINGETYRLPETKPERAGFLFEGWYTDKTGGNKVTAATVVDLSDSITLYARWTGVYDLVLGKANGLTGAVLTIDGEEKTVTSFPASFKDIREGTKIILRSVTCSENYKCAMELPMTFTMPTMDLTITPDTVRKTDPIPAPETGHTFKIAKVSEIKSIVLSVDGVEKTVTSFPASFTKVKEGAEIIFRSITCESGCRCTIETPYTFLMPAVDITVTPQIEHMTGPVPNPNPTPVNRTSTKSEKSITVFHGTKDEPVSGGIWSKDQNGVWHYSTNGIFYNTWGYIVNPYAHEGQNTADWFWFDVTGNMLTGWQYIKGKWYYLNPNQDGTLGALLLGPGKTPDGYEIDENGAWTGK